jgi:hypothetical protein
MWPHPTPGGNYFNKLGIVLFPKAFMSISAVLVQCFFRRYLNDSTPFLHFCVYLPFEGDLGSYLQRLVDLNVDVNPNFAYVYVWYGTH